jgi:hypothetical protein
MTIGAFYQCWKHSAATIQVIKQFRTFYPDSTVYLVSDDGHDYSPLAKKYNCIYEHSTINTKAALFHNLDEIRVYFERLTRALNEIKDEWCMLLEDDVYIGGKYDESLFRGELNGYKEGNFLYKNTVEFIKLFNPNTELSLVHGGFGGCVINVLFFRTIFNKNPMKFLDFMWNHTSYLKEYPDLTWGKACMRNTDIILSTLCYLYGGKVGPLLELRQLSEYNPHASIIHNYKELYNLPPNEEDKDLVILKQT